LRYVKEAMNPFDITASTNRVCYSVEAVPDNAVNSSNTC
jgi:hypothetical protein